MRVGDDSFPNSLVEGPVYLSRDWPNPAVPKVAAGVYTIWQGSELIYAGLYSRLSSHWAGRRSGDQFCVYVADRLVLLQRIVNLSCTTRRVLVRQ